MTSGLFALIAFGFGCIIGSFLNVVILRLPRDKKLDGRSRCPGCGHTLGTLELVPIVSFLVLRGKCRHCGKKISSRYAVIEAVTGLLFAAIAVYFPVQSLVSALILLKLWLIASLLLVVFVIDLEHFLILDNVLLVGTAGTLVINIVLDSITHTPLYVWHSYTGPAVALALLCPIPFFLLWYFSKGQWMGFGDVKLAVFLGAALAWPLSAVSLLLGVFLGGLVGLLLVVFGGKTLKTRVPFGTFLSLGALVAIFYGQALLCWYLSLLGLH